MCGLMPEARYVGLVISLIVLEKISPSWNERLSNT